MLRFSLIICTYNRASYLKETIEAILTKFRNKDNFELLIIDNNSSDHTIQVVEQFAHNPVLKYFLEEKQGVSHARNRGMAEAKNDVFILLDDDIDIQDDYLDLCEKLYSNDSNTIIGGKVLPYNVDIPAWLPSKFYYIASIFDLGDNPKHVTKLMGANYSMRREVAQKVGLYNPELGRVGKSLMGGEENDYFMRAHQMGLNILYHPGLVVYHKIENKLNKDYIFNYASHIGDAEAFIDSKNNKLRLYMRSVKSLLRVVAYHLYGSYVPNENSQVYFKVNKLHGMGYIKRLLKNL
jgi:glucosyl-dolichyl phosphate glucuronosyltransferase